MYSGLVSYDKSFAPEPDLALDWEILEDGARYRFRLRDDVVWHDGTPFTSADVAYTFQEVLTTFHSRTKASVGGLLESVETPDDTTVEFRFSEPYAPLLQQLDATEAPILPAHLFEGTDPQENPVNQAPVGTGPFMFSSYSPDEELVLVRNPNYFEPGLPKLDEVVMRVIPDAGSQVIALEAGEVDWLWGVPGPDLARLSGDDRFTTLKTLVNPGGGQLHHDPELQPGPARVVRRPGPPGHSPRPGPPGLPRPGRLRPGQRGHRPRLQRHPHRLRRRPRPARLRP